MDDEAKLPLTKQCGVCGHLMELISEEFQAMNTPLRHWQCTCGHVEGLYDRRDET